VILISSRERADFGARVDGSSAPSFLSKDEFSSAAVTALVESE
jgi:hypothetical protein